MKRNAVKSYFHRISLSCNVLHTMVGWRPTLWMHSKNNHCHFSLHQETHAVTDGLCCCTLSVFPPRHWSSRTVSSGWAPLGTASGQTSVLLRSSLVLHHKTPGMWVTFAGRQCRGLGGLMLLDVVFIYVCAGCIVLVIFHHDVRVHFIQILLFRQIYF